MNKKHIPAALCVLAAASVALAQQPTPATPGASSSVQGSARITTSADATTPVIVKVDGSRVIDASGTALGRIENIVLSPVGCAEAAVLTAANGRLIPIPWTLVRVSGDTRAVGTQPGANMVFTVNTDQARLAQAPSFTRSQWPDMSNNNWLQASLTFFGTASAAGAAGGGTNTLSGTGASGVTVTGGSTNTAIGGTATGGTSPGAIGTTGTGASNQDRFGDTATRVPTNSTGTALPPTGRPNPGRPDFDQPNTPPSTPDIPPGPSENRRAPDNTTRPPSATPANPATPATPATPASPSTRPSPPRSSPSTQP